MRVSLSVGLTVMIPPTTIRLAEGSHPVVYIRTATDDCIPPDFHFHLPVLLRRTRRRLVPNFSCGVRQRDIRMSCPYCCHRYCPTH